MSAAPRAGLLGRLITLQPGEAPALLASFATLMLMFASYTTLRPVRDALGITSGYEKIPELFWGVFVAMLLLQPLYGWLTSRYPRTVFLPWVYAFFAANLLIFWLWFRLQQDHVWIARTYFIWVSVFNLFVVAAFWSLMADVFSREQAGRLFGFIWAGASTGGLIGPLLANRLAVPVGAINLLPISAGLLLLSLTCMLRVIRLQRGSVPQPAVPGVPAPRGGGVGGGVFAAFVQVVRSPYLLGVVGFVLLMTWVSTFLYLEQVAFVKEAFHTTDERTRFFGGFDFSVQAASLLIQALLFSRLFRWLGMPVVLALVPVVMLAGYAAFALVPTFGVLMVVYGVRRVGDYALTRPSRDALFTVVSREEKYQAKSLIDTFAYRGGDATSGSLYQGLTQGLGWGPGPIGWLGAAIAFVWTLLAVGLGRSFERRGAGTAPRT